MLHKYYFLQKEIYEKGVWEEKVWMRKNVIIIFVKYNIQKTLRNLYSNIYHKISNKDLRSIYNHSEIPVTVPMSHCAPFLESLYYFKGHCLSIFLFF